MTTSSASTPARSRTSRERCADCGEILYHGLEAWYRADADRLRRFVAKLAAGRGLPASALDPQDIVHDTFEKLRAKLDIVEQPAAWLRTVAKRAVARSHHAQRRVAFAAAADYLTGWPQLWTTLSGTEPDVDQRIAVRVITRAIAALPDRQRQAVYLAKVEGMSVVEIADHLGITRATVDVHVHRGVLTLRQNLCGEEMPENSGNLWHYLAVTDHSRRWTWCPCCQGLPRHVLGPPTREYGPAQQLIEELRRGRFGVTIQLVPGSQHCPLWSMVRASRAFMPCFRVVDR